MEASPFPNFVRPGGEDKRADRYEGDPLQKLALGGTISIPAEIGIPCAGGKGSETSADALRLVPVQFTSAPAD